MIASLVAAREVPEFDCRFALVNYSSPDDMHDWVRSTLMEFIEERTLFYYRAKGFSRYNISHAKNVSGRCGSMHGELLVNLDADNILTTGFIRHMMASLRGERVILSFVRRGLAKRGCYGRLVYWRDDFLKVGGYNETFSGWGHDDQNLINRMKIIGVDMRQMSAAHAHCITHGEQDRVSYYAVKDRQVSDKRNRKMAGDQFASGLINPNGPEWGMARVEQNFGVELVLGPVAVSMPRNPYDHESIFAA